MDESVYQSAASEELIGRLPAPGADEPAALRQDIADEISDHLHCAARREHLQNSGNGPLTDQAALAAAIERFGEPAAIARRLWWDAMKERIMAQRILTIMATAAATAAVFACFVLWQSAQASRAEQTALLESQQSVMTAMLAELKGTQKSDGAQWQALKFRLIDEDKRPVAGVVNCGSNAGVSDTIRTGADGVAEFYLPPGNYTAGVQVGELHSGTSVLLPPGRPTERTIICPGRAVKTVPLWFKSDPTAPKDLNVYYIAYVWQATTDVDGQTWTFSSSDSGVRLLIDREWRVLGQLPKVPSSQHLSDGSATGQNDLTFPPQLQANPTLTLPEGLAPAKYYVNVSVYVVDPKLAETSNADVDGKGIPALRSLWGAGSYTQVSINTQAKDFDGVLISHRLNWDNLRRQIAAGPIGESTGLYPSASYPQAPPYPPNTSPYAAPPPNGNPYAPASPAYGPAQRVPPSTAPAVVPDGQAPQGTPSTEVPDQTPTGTRDNLLPQ